MASYNKFNQFTKDLLDGKHNFSSHIFKIALTNTPPSAANAVLTDITEIAAVNGYVAGGNACPVSDSTSGGVAIVLTSGPVVFTATGVMGPLRYAVLYNATTSGSPLIAWWDYGVVVNMANTDTLTISFDPTNGIFQIS